MRSLDRVQDGVQHEGGITLALLNELAGSLGTVPLDGVGALGVGIDVVHGGPVDIADEVGPGNVLEVLQVKVAVIGTGGVLVVGHQDLLLGQSGACALQVGIEEEQIALNLIAADLGGLAVLVVLTAAVLVDQIVDGEVLDHPRGVDGIHNQDVLVGGQLG